MIAATATASLLGTDSWRERLLYMIFAQARTTGRNGNRPNAIAATDFQRYGWEHYFLDATYPGNMSYSPHYGAQPAAFFLFAGAATGLQKLFTAPGLGYVQGLIRALMAGEMSWNESITNELACFMLPLAWLVRADDTTEHREWLQYVTEMLLSTQTSNGGIKQMFGQGPEAGRCSPCPARDNAAYATGEGPIMFDGSEAITDSLYTINFALAGLREAYGATGVARYAEAEKALGEYLARTQVYSQEHPELSGAWFRAFDYSKWEFWASDNDFGYGPWVTDSGWSNGWITTALSMQERNTTVWDVMQREGRQWDMARVLAICNEMLGSQYAAKYCVETLQ